MTNESSERVQASLIRLVAELRLQQYDQRLVCKALQKVRGSCWLCLNVGFRGSQILLVLQSVQHPHQTVVFQSTRRLFARR